MNNTTKSLLSLVVSLVLILGFAFWFGERAGNSGSETAQTSALPFSVAEEMFDFGEISMSAGEVTHDYLFNNGSGENITIKKMYTSCMCTSAQMIDGDFSSGLFGMAGHGFMPSINREVMSGKNFTVRVVFDPAAHGPAGVGLINRVVYLEDSLGRIKEVAFKAKVTP